MNSNFAILKTRNCFQLSKRIIWAFSTAQKRWWVFAHFKSIFLWNRSLSNARWFYCKKKCKIGKGKLYLTLTLLRGWWGRCEKNYLRKEEGREGGEKNPRSAPAGPGARTRDLPRARRGSSAARHRGGLFRQASLSVPIIRVGRLRNTMCCVFGDSFCKIL